MNGISGRCILVHVTTCCQGSPHISINNLHRTSSTALMLFTRLVIISQHAWGQKSQLLFEVSTAATQSAGVRMELSSEILKEIPLELRRKRSCATRKRLPERRVRFHTSQELSRRLSTFLAKMKKECFYYTNRAM